MHSSLSSIASQTAALTRPAAGSRARSQRRCAAWNAAGGPASAEGGQQDVADVSPAVRRRTALVSLAGTCGTLWATEARAAEADLRKGKIVRTEAEWKGMVGDDSFRILRQARTELPFTSPLNSEKRAGLFVCAGCGSALFDSSTKYDSGTGWPSFYKAVDGAVREVPDYSIMFLPRAEVRCAQCEGHLGHVFDDGPAPTGQRYCMNGLSLRFVPAA